MTVTPPSSPWGARRGTFGTLYLALRTIARRSKGSMLADRADERTRAVGSSLVLAFLFGTMMAILFIPLPVAQGAYVYAGGTMLFAFTSIVGRQAAIVASPEDDGSLFHLPIDSRTYLAARLCVAARSAVGPVLAYTAVGALVAGAKTGSPLALVGTVVTVGVAYLFALVIAFVVARVGLAFRGRRRGQAIAEFGAALLSMTPFLVYILPTEAIQLVFGFATSAGIPWASPPAWCSAWIELAYEPTPVVAARALLGVASVAAILAVLLFGLGRRTIERQTAFAANRADVTRRGSRTLGPGFLARFCLRVQSPEARAGWILTRTVRRAGTPSERLQSLLFTALLPLAVVGAFGDELRRVADVVPFLLMLASASAWAQIIHTEFPDAAWLYEALPIRRPGHLYGGTLIGAWAWNCLPSLVVLSTALLIARPWSEAVSTIAYSLGLGTALSTLGSRTWRARAPLSTRFRTTGAFHTKWVLLAQLVLASVGSVVWYLVLPGPLLAYGLAAGATALAFVALVALRAELEHGQPAWLDPVKT